MTNGDPRGSLPDWVYGEIRQRIIKGVYPQGSRLVEQAVADELEVSRVPLREVFPRLELDGFIRTERNRGAVVETWTPKMVDDLFDVRLAVEVAAARIAADRAKAGASMATLWALQEADRNALAGNDPYGVAEASAQLHYEIGVLTGNALMESFLRAISGRVVWLFYLTSDLDQDEAWAEHDELLQVIQSGNAPLAEAVQYAHIAKSLAPTASALFGT
ncbi:MAG: GntR family transcriptional regulator [Bifidobacteriaceae bacterium]|jgi:DNA-binding GntR family transcriptional regulator|nr:GntR family transcriptional regulator [Bifidobacteriaceae bacterium]